MTRGDVFMLGMVAGVALCMSVLAIMGVIW